MSCLTPSAVPQSPPNGFHGFHLVCILTWVKSLQPAQELPCPACHVGVPYKVISTLEHMKCAMKEELIACIRKDDLARFDAALDAMQPIEGPLAVRLLAEATTHVRPDFLRKILVDYDLSSFGFTAQLLTGILGSQSKASRDCFKAVVLEGYLLLGSRKDRSKQFLFKVACYAGDCSAAIELGNANAFFWRDWDALTLAIMGGSTAIIERFDNRWNMTYLQYEMTLPFIAQCRVDWVVRNWLEQTEAGPGLPIKGHWTLTEGLLLRCIRDGNVVGCENSALRIARVNPCFRLFPVDLMPLFRSSDDESGKRIFWFLHWKRMLRSRDFADDYRDICIECCVGNNVRTLSTFLKLLEIRLDAADIAEIILQASQAGPVSLSIRSALQSFASGA